MGLFFMNDKRSQLDLDSVIHKKVTIYNCDLFMNDKKVTIYDLFYERQKVTIVTFL